MGQEQTLIELITVLSKDPNINSIAPEKVKLLEELKMNIFTKQNDFKKAFLSAQKILSLSETFRSKDHTDALIKLDQKLEESEQKKILLKTELDLSKKTQLLGSIFGLFLLTVIVSLIYIKYQNKLNQETIKYSEIKAKSEERDRISKDLHDDLGSSMTSIRLLSEILVESSSEKSAKRIGEIALENIDKLNEIVWFENPQNDYISSLTAYLKNYITSIKSFSNQQINIEINQDIPNVKISGIKRRAIILAFKEAINNALKHSNATLITIDITDQNQNYIITIHDNGIKYNIEDLNRKSGIDIMKKRIESVGGQFEIETQHNKIIKMTIPHIIK
jgi:signal transduction histidine kinase